MCILNEIQFWPKVPFSAFFKKIQESSPYSYASVGCNKSVCEHVKSDAHDKRFTTNNWKESYVLSAKTGHSGVENRNIRFYQENRTIRFGKPDYPVWQTGTSDFFRKPNFPQFARKPDAYYAKSFVTAFSSLETCYTVKSSKRAIICRHLSKYTFKDSSKHW